MGSPLPRPTTTRQYASHKCMRRHRGSSSLKWTKYGDGILPLWVADMDFRAPQCVIDALKVRCTCMYIYSLNNA